MGKRHEQTFLQRHPDGQQTHRKILNIREMQMKTMMRYHLAPVRMAKINNAGNNRCWQGCREREPSYTVGGNASWCNHSGEQYEGSLKS